MFGKSVLRRRSVSSYSLQLVVVALPTWSQPCMVSLSLFLKLAAL